MRRYHALWWLANSRMEDRALASHWDLVETASALPSGAVALARDLKEAFEPFTGGDDTVWADFVGLPI